jgi:hypothetical protein
MKTYAKASSNLLKGLNILNYDVLFNNFVENEIYENILILVKNLLVLMILISYDVDYLGMVLL